MSINKGEVGSIRSRRTSSNSPPSQSDGLDVPLLEASFSSLTSQSSRSSFRVEYSYISTDKTAEAIQQCERFILNPYSNALKVIGWLPFSGSRLATLGQAILVSFWTFCILATMMTQLFSCFKRDAFVPGKNVEERAAITLIPPINVGDGGGGDLFGDEFNSTVATDGAIQRNITCHKHVVSSLLLLDLVVIAAYFFGVYLFTRGETEYLFGLASHVFIKNADACSSSPRLIKTIGVLYICGLLWLGFSLIVRLMTAVSVQLFDSGTVILWPDFEVRGGLKFALLVVSLFGFFTFDVVYMFSIMNYIAQGELNIYLLWDIRKLIELRRHDDLDGAIKDTQKCRQYLDVLNGKTATLTALSLFVLGSLALSTLIDVDRLDKSASRFISEDFRILAIVSSSLNGICWTLLFILPFIQAARVTYWCDQLKDIGTEIRGRVFAPYNDVDDVKQLDLDSFLSYLHSVKLRASIFGIPIYPWLIYLVVVTFSFTMLVLFQLDAYSIAQYI